MRWSTEAICYYSLLNFKSLKLLGLLIEAFILELCLQKVCAASSQRELKGGTLICSHCNPHLSPGVRSYPCHRSPCVRGLERKREASPGWSCLSLKQRLAKEAMPYFLIRSSRSQRRREDKMWKMCLIFSQGHPELLLACYGFPVPQHD